MTKPAPHSIQKLLALIGYDATAALIKKWGGLPILVPKTKAGLFYAELEAVIGQPAAEVLIKSDLAGFSLAVPKGSHVIARARYPQIRADFDGGLTMAELVAKHKLTSRQVLNIVNKPEPDPAEATQASTQFVLDLFCS